MMPLGSRIGTGPGIANPHHIELIVEKQDDDASVRGAAEVLFCHPNAVRHRSRRIEKRSRSHSRPKDVAELCSASEVHRRLSPVDGSLNTTWR
jgi:hypothetical protein